MNLHKIKKALQRQLYSVATRREGQHVIRVERVAQDYYKAIVFDEDSDDAPRRLITIVHCLSLSDAFGAATRWLHREQGQRSWRVRRDIRLGKYA